MPLTSSTPVPITPAPPPPARKTLPVARVTQSQTNWCWAACAQMVLGHYGRRVRQCQAAVLLVGRGCCVLPARCNVACAVADVSRLYLAFGLLSVYHPGTVSFSTIQSEINAGRPVEVCFAWYKGGGHVAIISGWEQDSHGDEWVTVNDPHPSHRAGAGIMLYSALASPYGLGLWVATWTDLQ